MEVSQFEHVGVATMAEAFLVPVLEEMRVMLAVRRARFQR